MQVLDFIKAMNGMSENDLRSINTFACDELKRRRNLKSLKAAAELRVGDKVKFDSGRRGMVYGVVTDVRVKTAEVRADTGHNWKVECSLLQKIAPSMVTKLGV